MIVAPTLCSPPNNVLNSRERFKEFIYDASYWSFDPNDPHFVSQSDVYNDLGKLTVNNAFDGYNACVCAYGQTGSGKSFSMMGQTNSEHQQGLIPRISKVKLSNLANRLIYSEIIMTHSTKALFERSLNVNSTSQNTTFRAEVSFLEIYNEKVRDLLRSTGDYIQKKHITN